MYISTKTYGHEIGLSTAFRQWRAGHSHCRFIHGYALSVRIEFEADELDSCNWVMDFGNLKPVKEWLTAQFDHKLLVASDDPDLRMFIQLDKHQVADIRVVVATGCEAFAELILKWVNSWLHNIGAAPRVRVRSVAVAEHGANSAIYTNPNLRVL